jgi:hypothetical protein
MQLSSPLIFFLKSGLRLSFLYIAVALFVYFQIIFSQNLIDVDFNLVLGPLLSVESIKDYFNLFLSRDLYDIQPVRDLSLLLDIQIFKLFGVQVHGITNVFLWAGTCIYLERILNCFFKSNSSKLLPLIVLTHPMLAWVLSWPTARKHILAVFFIMIASYKTIQLKQGIRKVEFSIFVFYLLACFTQPIILFWPIIFYIYLGRKLKNHVSLVVILLLTLGTTAILNYLYYTELYTIYSGANKLSSNHLDPLIKLLSISRSFSQIVLPVSFAQSYSKNSLENLIGLPVFAILTYIAYLKIGTKKTLLLFSFSIFPLVLINLKATNIFVSDTYLLIPLVGTVCLTFSVINFFFRRESIQIKISLFVLALLIPKTVYETRLATNPSLFFKFSYLREPSCSNSISYANELLRQNNLITFINVSNRALKNKCAIGGFAPSATMNQVYSFRIFVDGNINKREKLELIQKIRYVTPETVYLQSILQLNIGLKKEGIQQFSRIKDKLGENFKPILRSLHSTHCINSGCKEITIEAF